MRIIPHLEFDGQCEAAFRHYEACLDGKLAFLRHHDEGGIPASSPELAGKVFHATLTLGDQTLTGVDVAPAAYMPPRGFALQLNIERVDKAERIFQALSTHATIRFPMQRTFWSGHYGALTDRFGIPWEINCAA